MLWKAERNEAQKGLCYSYFLEFIYLCYEKEVDEKEFYLNFNNRRSIMNLLDFEGITEIRDVIPITKISLPWWYSEKLKCRSMP